MNPGLLPGVNLATLPQNDGTVAAGIAIIGTAYKTMSRVTTGEAFRTQVLNARPGAGQSMQAGFPPNTLIPPQRVVVPTGSRPPKGFTAATTPQTFYIRSAQTTCPLAATGALAIPLPDGRYLVMWPKSVSMAAWLYTPSTRSWVQAPNRPTETVTATYDTSFACCLSDGRVMTMGGIYNPTTNAWTTIAAPSGTSTDYNTEGFLVPTKDGKALLVNGSNVNTTVGVQLYDPAGNTWTSKAQRPVNFSSGGYGWVDPNNKVHFRTHILHYILDLSANTWTMAGSSGPNALFNPLRAITFPDGRVIDWGGSGTGAMYNPATNAWTTSTLDISQTAAVGCHQAGPTGQFLVVAPSGAVQEGQGPSLPTALRFGTRPGGFPIGNNIGNTTIPFTTGMPQPRGWVKTSMIDPASKGTLIPKTASAPTGWNNTYAPDYVSAFPMPGGKILLHIGVDGGTTDMTEWDPTTGDTTPGTGMGSIPKYPLGSGGTYTLYCAGCVAANGDIIMHGGTNGNTSDFGKIAIFSSTNKTWTTIRPAYDPASILAVVTRTYGHTMTTLQDGTILVAGGIIDNGAILNVGIYNPATNTVAQKADYPFYSGGGSSYSGAILLQDGRVLIAGGAAVNGNPANNWKECWIYSPYNNTWSRAADLPREGIWGVALTLLPDGDVLFASSTWDLYAYTYNVQSNTWTEKTSLKYPARGTVGKFVTTTNGDVYLVGGSGKIIKPALYNGAGQKTKAILKMR